MNETNIVEREIGTIKQSAEIAQFLIDQKAFPKNVDTVWKAFMLIQAWRDLGIKITSVMSWLAIVNWVITVYWTVGAMIMKKAWYDWKVIEWTSKKCKIKIWKWESEEKATKVDEVEYSIDEAIHAWIAWGDARKKYPQEMIYWKCLARARKRICPEVLDWVAIYEDYQELDKSNIVVDEEEVMKWFEKAEEKIEVVVNEEISQDESLIANEVIND